MVLLRGGGGGARGSPGPSPWTIVVLGALGSRPWEKAPLQPLSSQRGRAQ